MDMKIKKRNPDGIVRVETSGVIKEVRIKEDMMRPGGETVELCFMGKNSSGIVELSTEELDGLYHQLKSRTHLIKGSKILYG